MFLYCESSEWAAIDIELYGELHLHEVSACAVYAIHRLIRNDMASYPMSVDFDPGELCHDELVHKPRVPCLVEWSTA